MISIIISTYKHLDNLELLFLGLEKQQFKDFEVIVAEDDAAAETVDFLRQVKEKYFFPIQHVSQEDKGFRKCKILNKALTIAQGEKIVFLDSDCIPHRKLTEEYNKNIKKNVFCSGRRVMLTEKISNKLKKTNNLKLLQWLNLFLCGCTRLKYGLYIPWYPKKRGKKIRGVLGCNMGGMKQDLMAINGFDEDYELPTVGEDTDLQWRLEKSGIKIQIISNNVIVYHLYHKLIHDSNSIEQIKNRQNMYHKQEVGCFFCKNGVTKQLNENL